MEKLALIAGTILLLVFGYAIINSQKQKNSDTIKTVEIVTNVPSQKNVQVSPSAEATSSQGTVSFPQETDIIRTYFNLIEERRVSEAVMMMSDLITGNDSEKQAWGVQLNAMKSVKVLDVAASMPEEWKDNEHTYKVTLDIVMDPSSVNGPIPYHGYDNGKNIRWVTLQKTGNVWKVMGIGTGP